MEPPALHEPIQDPIDAGARYALGELHARGAAGLPVNLQQAQHWFLLAASQNWPAAHTALGQLAESRGPQTALGHYRVAALAGDPEAQYLLSRLLRAEGRDPTEHLQGHQWLVLAAQAGHAQALLEWSELLQSHDPELAQAAVLRAAQAGLPEAEYQRALQLLNSSASGTASDARNWLEQAAAKDHLAARSRLGLLLCTGAEGVRDIARGLPLLQSAADQGDPVANWNLALMYAAGTSGLQHDVTAALERCRLAADTGFAPAMATMGLLCASLQRAEEAVHWWRQAAQANDIEAQFNLAQALQAGRGVPHDSAQAMDWMQRAAEAGLPQAQTELGILYATGRGVAVDPIEAHKWFVLGRLGGSKTAMHNVDQSRQLLSQDQIEEGERRARGWRFVQKRHD
jgi:TPR repeat protein